MFDHLSPLTKFAIVMSFVLLMPLLAGRLRLPGVLGYILGGIVLGPGGIGMIKGDGQAIELWSELGKLLFMFFVGFEIDIEQFAKARVRAALFGAMTFLLPFSAGLLLGSLCGYGWTASILIGAMIGTHSLLAHPILTKLGLTTREPVVVAIGATIFTDIASLVLLAVVVTAHQTGFSALSLGRQLAELAVFVPFVLFVMSWLARKMLIRFGGTSEGRIAILLVFIIIAAEFARMIHLEGIVGAFLIGIAVKSVVRGKYVVEQLEVLANALFIPAFLLTTGLLVDFKLLGQTLWTKPALAIGLVASLLIGKWLAARLATRMFHYSALDGRVMFSLTIPQMAEALAMAVVGYQTTNAAGERLLDQSFVNVTVVLVIATSVLGPILTERWGRKLVPVDTAT